MTEPSHRPVDEIAGRYDPRSFHRAALDLGSLGLDPLQAALARLS